MPPKNRNSKKSSTPIKKSTRAPRSANRSESDTSQRSHSSPPSARAASTSDPAWKQTRNANVELVNNDSSSSELDESFSQDPVYTEDSTPSSSSSVVEHSLDNESSPLSRRKPTSTTQRRPLHGPSEKKQSSEPEGQDVIRMQQPPEQKDRNKSQPWKISLDQKLCAAVSFVVLVALLTYLVVYSEPDVEVKCVKYENPADEMKSALKQILPDQSDDFYRVITSNIRSVALFNKKPSCIMIASDQADAAVKGKIATLAGSIECALTGLGKSAAIQGSERQGQGQRSPLEVELSKEFNSGNKVAVIYDVDKLSFETAKIFYKFCDDNDDPQHPGTIMLLTIGYNNTDEPSDWWLEKRLRQSWSDDDDKITPILSRIANSLAILVSTK